MTIPGGSFTWAKVIGSMIRRIALATLFVASVAQARPGDVDLKAECARVYTVYPALMLATMLEGPVNCGNPEEDEVIDCAANETPEEKIAHARRFAIRQHQENAYKPADQACTAWEKDRKSPALIEAATAAIGAARAADTWRPEAK